jgi:hypothetical protein
VGFVFVSSDIAERDVGVGGHNRQHERVASAGSALSVFPPKFIKILPESRKRDENRAFVLRAQFKKMFYNQ